MRSTMRILILLAIITILSSCTTTTTYYLVRHAEKKEATPDPELSATGHARAEALCDSLLNTGIEALYVSDRLRTRQTAEPLAKALSIKSTVIAPTRAGTQELINRLRQHKGDAVLVVGHSNTVPLVIDSLMQQPQGITLSEHEFSNLFVVTIQKGVTAKRWLEIKHYGEKETDF